MFSNATEERESEILLLRTGLVEPEKDAVEALYADYVKSLKMTFNSYKAPMGCSNTVEGKT